MITNARILLGGHSQRHSQFSEKLLEMPGFSLCQQIFIYTGSRALEPYLNFLQHRLRPPNRSNAMKIQKKSSRFFVDGALLFRKGFNQAPLRCIRVMRQPQSFKKSMQTSATNIKGGLETNQANHAPWLLPLSFARRCQAYQLHGNRIHAPTVELHCQPLHGC